MNTIAEILRNCAYGLPIERDSETSLLEEEQARTTSPFICDNLGYMRDHGECNYSQSLKTQNFLYELGMPNNFSAFKLPQDQGVYGLDYTVEHQTLRAWWLLFAADLAEEWGV